MRVAIFRQPHTPSKFRYIIYGSYALLTGLHHLALVLHHFRQVCHYAGSLVRRLDIGAVHHFDQHRQAPFQHDVHFTATIVSTRRGRQGACEFDIGVLVCPFQMRYMSYPSCVQNECIHIKSSHE